MLIIHGKRRTERREGFVADFCPLCRRESAFRLVRVGLVSHLYGISIGQGELQGHTRVCLGCEVETWTERDRYAAVQKSFTTAELASSIRMQQLIQQTQPELRTRRAERLEIEEQVRRNPLAIEFKLRQELIKEPFSQLAYGFEKRFESAVVDLPLLGTFVAGMALIIAAIAYADRIAGPEHAPALMLSVLLAVLVAILVQALQVKPRHVRRRLFPVLALALKPLAPKPQEVEAALRELRQQKLAIARHIKVPALMSSGLDATRRSQVIS
jgi:hypothetical protein